MSESARWDDRYRQGNMPWQTGRPSTELMRVVSEERIPPGRAIDLGCGLGTHSIWLAQQGFDVLGVDFSPTAIAGSRQAAATAGVSATFVLADLLARPDLGGPRDFFFDRGCYHVLRKFDLGAYLALLDSISRPGTIGLIIAGKPRDPDEGGPPVVTKEELRRELGSSFQLASLREILLDETEPGGSRPPAWSCLLRK